MTLPDLDPGDYLVTVTATGYRCWRVDGGDVPYAEAVEAALALLNSACDATIAEADRDGLDAVAEGTR